MAFTAAQKLSLARILGVTPSYLTAQITALGATFTADVQTAVEAELARWVTYGAKFAKLHPKESNKGVETFPDAVKADIKRNIAFLLEMETVDYTTNSMGTLQIA